MLFLNGYEVKPTIFPDRTSQVWKLPEEALQRESVIRWEFEHEGEVMHLAQLVLLLRHKLDCRPELVLPFLPYGRQDKRTANDATFALWAFADIISEMGFSKITTLDAHSDVFLDATGATSEDPLPLIRDAAAKVCADVIGLPDQGAVDRYKISRLRLPQIVGQKERDPATGHIVYGEVFGDARDKRVLIVDDICDGGMTFILFAKRLYAAGARVVSLYTTHGIYSKGLTPLRDAGIQRIFNRKGEET